MHYRMPGRSIRRWRTVAWFAAGGVATWLAATALATWAATRRPRPLFRERVPTTLASSLEQRWIETGDGYRLGAWLGRGRDRAPCALLLHGYGGSRSRSLGPKARWLTRHGYCVLAVSMRAHGDSTGEHTRFGWTERGDVLAGVHTLRSAMPGRRIVVVGTSMGAAAAIFAAGATHDGPDAYLLEAPYADLAAATLARLRLRAPAPIALAVVTGMRLWAPLLLGAAADRIRPIDHVARIPEAVPVVFIAGGRDRRAPLRDIEAMHARIRSHSRVIVYPRAHHFALYRAGGARYFAELEGLLR